MKNSSIKLSIVIPVFKVEAYIAECLQSIVSQKESSKIEIIVVDDGSPDNSMMIVEKYATEYRMIHIERQMNSGLSAARNKGISVAHGEYIWFLDSDDWLLPNSLVTLLNAIEEHPDVDVFMSALRNTSVDQGTFVDDYVIEEPRYMTGCEFLQKKYPKTGAVRFFVRRELLSNKQIEFYPGILHEDVLFCYTMLYYAQKVWMFNVPLYGRRLGREGSIMNSITMRNVNDMMFVSLKLFEFCESKVVLSDRHWYYELSLIPVVMAYGMLCELDTAYNNIFFNYQQWKELRGKFGKAFGKVNIRNKVKIVLLAFCPHLFIKIRNYFNMGR